MWVTRTEYDPSVDDYLDRFMTAQNSRWKWNVYKKKESKKPGHVTIMPMLFPADCKAAYDIMRQGFTAYRDSTNPYGSGIHFTTNSESDLLSKQCVVVAMVNTGHNPLVRLESLHNKFQKDAPLNEWKEKAIHSSRLYVRDATASAKVTSHVDFDHVFTLYQLNAQAAFALPLFVLHKADPSTELAALKPPASTNPYPCTPTPADRFCAEQAVLGQAPSEDWKAAVFGDMAAVLQTLGKQELLFQEYLKTMQDTVQWGAQTFTFDQLRDDLLKVIKPDPVLRDGIDKIALLSNPLLYAQFFANAHLINSIPTESVGKGPAPPSDIEKRSIDNFIKLAKDNGFPGLCKGGGSCSMRTRNGRGSTPVLKVGHCTKYPLSAAICQSGFWSIAALDPGYYGVGVYTTTYSSYGMIYAGATPAFIIALALPGAGIMSMENRDDYLGTNLDKGVSAAYISVDRKGMVIPSGGLAEAVDELNIPSTGMASAAVLPIAVLGFPFDLVYKLAMAGGKKQTAREELVKAIFVGEVDSYIITPSTAAGTDIFSKQNIAVDAATQQLTATGTCQSNARWRAMSKGSSLECPHCFVLRNENNDFINIEATSVRISHKANRLKSQIEIVLLKTGNPGTVQGVQLCGFQSKTCLLADTSGTISVVDPQKAGSFRINPAPLTATFFTPGALLTLTNVDQALRTSVPITIPFDSAATEPMKFKFNFVTRPNEQVHELGVELQDAASSQYLSIDPTTKVPSLADSSKKTIFVFSVNDYGFATITVDGPSKEQLCIASTSTRSRTDSITTDSSIDIGKTGATQPARTPAPLSASATSQQSKASRTSTRSTGSGDSLKLCKGSILDRTDFEIRVMPATHTRPAQQTPSSPPRPSTPAPVPVQTPPRPTTPTPTPTPPRPATQAPPTPLQPQAPSRPSTKAGSSPAPQTPSRPSTQAPPTPS